ncbi:MAG TPA: hypothetical protein VJO12_09375 [Stellaceae bacterium]|nr:hypothetical protein [Stellaceae bacterium]
MSISVHSMNVDRDTPSSTVYWCVIFGVVLLALAMLPLLHADPAAALGTSVGMLVP